jgi:multiple sugar transport system substrate-binding protein
MKQIRFAIIALLVLVFVVTACAPAAPAAAPAAEAPAAEAPAAEAPAAEAPAAEEAPAGEFNWKAYEGETISLLMVKHPFATTMEERLDQFKELTGINVVIETIPEETFFDKLTTVFAGQSDAYDAYMVGSYMIWQYSPAGYMEPLDAYLSDPTKTPADYNVDDIYPFLLKDMRWSGVDGDPTGTGNLYALPWGFHTSNLIYRKSILKECGVEVPKDLEELYAAGLKLKECKPDMIPLAVRGTRGWATIHPSVMSWFTSYGGKDFEEVDGKLQCALNKNPEAVAATELWGKIIREIAQPNYADYTWYDVANSFTQGQAAMFYDADIIGYFNRESSAFPDDWGLAPPPGKPGGDPTANEWIWAIGMNAFSKKKDAAWLWMVWSTMPDFVLDAAVNGLTVDPPRASTWEAKEWQDHIAPFTGYVDTWKAIEPYTKVYYTPQAAFFEATTEWSAALQEIHAGKSAQEALDEACKRIDESLE